MDELLLHALDVLGELEEGGPEVVLEAGVDGVHVPHDVFILLDNLVDMDGELVERLLEGLKLLLEGLYLHHQELVLQEDRVALDACVLLDLADLTDGLVDVGALLLVLARVVILPALVLLGLRVEVLEEGHDVVLELVDRMPLWQCGRDALVGGAGPKRR